MARPNFPPDWSTNADFPMDGNPWQGTPTRVDPGAGMRAGGFVPEEPRAAEHENFLFGNHGDWLKYLDSLSGDTIGRPLSFAESFLGDRINRSIWQVSGNNAAVVLADDSANGGSGSLYLDAALSGIGWSATVQTAPIVLGAANWRFAVRLRPWDAAGWSVSGSVKHGLITSSGMNADAYFQVSGAPAQTIHAVINGTSHDLGVAVDASAYHLLEMINVAGTVYVFIDSALNTSFAWTSGIATFSHVVSGSTNGDGSIYVDDCALYVERYSTTGAFVSPAPEHVENFYNIAITDGALGNTHEWLDLSFATNFPDTNYGAFDVTIYVSDSGPNVGWTLRLKTNATARILFDAPFNGTVSLKIKEPA